jgi:hypothetical protein
VGLELLAPAVPATPESWAAYVHKHVTEARETARQAAAAERVKLYRDDYARLLEGMLSHVFKDRAVLQRVLTLTPLIASASFVRRVADELGRPLYARPPMRRVVLPDEADAATAQEAYNRLAAEMELDAKMDTIARLLTACAAVFAFVRYVADIGVCLDVMTPDMLSVIPHPDVPTRALAVCYVKTWHNDQPFERVVWDDQRYFTMNRDGAIVGAVTEHNFETIPFVEFHQRGRTCHYWQETRGADLIAQTRQSMFLDTVVARKVKTQSHKQFTHTGEMSALVKDQVVDEESILMSDGGQLNAIDLESNPLPIIEVKLANEAAVGASYGLSRDRLNQKAGSGGDDAGLQERTAELAAVLVPGEVRIFELARKVAAEHHDATLTSAIPMDAVVLVDLGQIHNRVDRKTQLDTRQTERSMGLRSVVDDVLEDNPEYGGNRKLAWARVREALDEEAIYIELRRALNTPADATAEEPGQSPEQNGAMGPAVRDGHMSRDEAAEQASEGPPPSQQYQ